MQLRIQLLWTKPSGLFQFRNNHWTISHLDIFCDSSKEVSAHSKASPYIENTGGYTFMSFMPFGIRIDNPSVLAIHDNTLFI
jgi:hypothetical protein